MAKSRWIYQYLKDESLYYLTEHHPQEGIVSEFYFHTLFELNEYVMNYNIPILIHENAEIEEVGSYLAELGLANLEINIYSKNKYKKYKSNHRITIEMIKQTDAEDLGYFLKKMVEDLENKE